MLKRAPLAARDTLQFERQVHPTRIRAFVQRKRLLSGRVASATDGGYFAEVILITRPFAAAPRHGLRLEQERVGFGCVTAALAEQVCA